MRIAAIDIGTNSIHMVIARAVRATEFEVLDREREVVQVGRGSFEGGRLRRDAMQRTIAALRRFVQLARRRQVDRILCTTTAAVREAANGGEFLSAARAASGVGPRVIPAEEEGRLIYLAVRAALQMDERPALIVDIGGGSVQLVAATRERLLQVVSVPLGALRLTEDEHLHDPPLPREIARLQRTIRKQLRGAFHRLGALRPARVYGSSGAIHALAQVANWNERGEGIRQINGHVFAIESLERQVRRLLRLHVAQRERLPGIDAQRAEIIVPGALVLHEVLRQAKAGHIVLSDYGVREGLVTDWLMRHAREVSALEPVEDLRLRSVLGLLTRMDSDGPHPRHVAKLALQLWDELTPWHGLDPRSRDLLHFAALLHDVGAVIGYDGHAAHSSYVIRNGGLRGMDADDVETIATVARYHGKAMPRKKRDATYAMMPRRERRMVRWIAAILRVAEGLDRSHYQRVRDVRVATRAGQVWILATTQHDAQLELWAARQRLAALEKLVGVPVRLEPDPRAARLRQARVSRPGRVAARDADAAGEAPRDGDAPRTTRATRGSRRPTRPGDEAAPTPPRSGGRGKSPRREPSPASVAANGASTTRH